MAVACVLCLILVKIFARFRRQNSSNQTDVNIAPQSADTPETILSAAHLNLDDYLTDIMRVSSNMAQTAPNAHQRKQSVRILRSAYNAKRAMDNFASIEQIDKQKMALDPQSKCFKASMETVIKKWGAMVKSDQIEFTHFVDPILPDCIFIDHARFTQIVENILEQSVSMTHSGRIHLHITGEPKPDSEWNLKIILADTGDGLTEDTLAYILDPSKARGTLRNANTLNYAASARLTKLISGTFDIVSKQGRGTEIAISLPMRAANMFLDGHETLSGPALESGLLQGMRVLVIEDDKSSRNVLQTFLEPEGCVVHCISDGQDAIKTLNIEPDFDLIFMDIRMAGLNGIETTKLIRKSKMRYSKIPIIAITGDTSAETNAMAMMAGMDLFLNKPVSAKGLFGGISFVLDLQADIKAVAQ